jgi:hypothetical protein
MSDCGGYFSHLTISSFTQHHLKPRRRNIVSEANRNGTRRQVRFFVQEMNGECARDAVQLAAAIVADRASTLDRFISSDKHLLAAAQMYSTTFDPEEVLGWFTYTL